MPNEIGEKQLKDPKTGRFVEGNPGGGRPKGSCSVVERIKTKLEEVPEGEKRTYRDILVDMLFSKVTQERDIFAIKDIINRVDGMPKQAVDHTTNGKDLPAPILPL